MFFFFRQKTAYEWRISDWSSDVCSSDRVMPIDRTGEDRPSLFVGWIDALPVPAALIRPLARGNFSLHASNGAFDRLELTPGGARSPIEMRRANERAAQRQGEGQEFSCRLGEGAAARDLRGSSGPLTDEEGDTVLFLLTLIYSTQEIDRKGTRQN